MPRVAPTLYDFVGLDDGEYLEVAEAVFRIFDRQDWLRVNRARARIKVLVDKIGIDEMRKLVDEERQGDWVAEREFDVAGLRLDVDEEDRAPGVPRAPTRRPTATAASSSASARRTSPPSARRASRPSRSTCPRGDLSPEQLRALADIARAYSGGWVRTTVHQNLLLRWVRDETRLRGLGGAARARASATPGADQVGDVVSCPGTDSCKLGITSSMGLNAAIRERLDEMQISDPLTRKLHIKMSGCPNGCSQHHIANIGFYGASIKAGEHTIPAYVAHIAGNYEGGEIVYGQRLKVRLPAKRVPEAVERWIRLYEADRTDGEEFNAFAARVGHQAPSRTRSATSRCRSSSASTRWSTSSTGTQGPRSSCSAARASARSDRHRWPRPPSTSSSSSCAPSRRRSRSSSTSCSPLAPHTRVVTIDTGVLFPETLQTWRAFEERFGVHVDVEDASNPSLPWTGTPHCCGDVKVAALERALAGADAWITGIRREQAATRANAQFVEFDDKRSMWKYNPLADWTERDLWRRIHERDLPYHPLHDQGYASIGCAPCTQPGSGREGRWAGTDKVECGLHVGMKLDPPPDSSRPRPSTSCARSRPSSSARCCCSAAARTRSCCCAWPRRPSARRASPSRSCTSTPATTSPRSSTFRDRRVAELGERLIVASVQDSIDAGRVVEETGPRASRNRLQTTTLLDAIAEHGFDAAFGGARRDEERARAKERIMSLPRRLRRLGPQGPAPRAVEPLQRAHPPGRARARLPALELDRARRLAVHRARRTSRCPRSTSPTSARSSAATGCSTPSPRTCSSSTASEPFTESVRYRTVGDMRCTGAVASTRDRPDRRRGGDRGDDDHRARRDARRRQGLRGRDGGPQGCRLLLAPTCCASRRLAASTTASRPSSGGCCTTPRRSSPTSSTTCAAATASSTSRG